MFTKDKSFGGRHDGSRFMSSNENQLGDRGGEVTSPLHLEDNMFRLSRYNRDVYNSVSLRYTCGCAVPRPELAGTGERRRSITFRNTFRE